MIANKNEARGEAGAFSRREGGSHRQKSSHPLDAEPTHVRTNAHHTVAR